MSDIETLFSPAELGSLQADGPIPLYHQLYQLMKRHIKTGSLAHGIKLPTEAQIASGFGVSRITAKRVMDLLAADGLVERKRGKGSHVVYQASDSELDAPLVGMLDQLADMSRNTRVKVLHVDKQVPAANIREDMGLADNEAVHYVVRVRFSDDDVPFAYYESWTRGISQGFDAQAIEKRQRFAIMADNGHQISHVEQYLSAAAAGSVVADQLQLHVGDPVLTLVRQSYNHDGELIDQLHCHYHPDRFHYRMNLSMEDYAGVTG